MRADMILYSGRIWTGERTQPWATSIAIKDGVIIAIGSDDAVRIDVTTTTDTIDLGGRTLLPGFQDAHVHPVDGGLRALSCDLSSASCASECLELVASYVDSHPDHEVIVGDGWLLEWFEGGVPTAEILDSVVGARIAFLTDAGGHSAWVSSAALVAAGIDHLTPEPRGGRIERREGGVPVGVLHDEAMESVKRLLPKMTGGEMRQALRLGQKHLLSLGVTAWQDAIVTPDIDAAYLELAGLGELVGRASAALWWERGGGIDQLSELTRRRHLLEEAGVRASSVKLMLDGVIEVGTAWLLKPYCGCHAGADGMHTGDPFIPSDIVNAAVAEMELIGFQAHFHAIGDAAVRQALDAVAAARRINGPTEIRHHIAHVQVVHPQDIGRFASLGVVANIQTLWACHEPQMDDLTMPVLGDVRSQWQYPFESLRKNGARLACGSDWPVSSASPLEQIAVAVSRVCRNLGGKETQPVFVEDEILSLQHSLEAFTIGSAYINCREDRSGSLLVGKDADTVVLDDNIFELAGRDLSDVKVDLTLISGEVVYER
ncbi:MAG: amidohydrolase [Ferrimicrobium sp.]